MNEAVRLDTLSGVRQEMGRVYRLANNGRIDPKDANALVFMLAQIVRTFRIEREEREHEEAERRLAEAEGLLAAKGTSDRHS